MEGVDADTFAHHVRLMIQEGFLEGKVSQGLGGESAAAALRLTWKGCDFADAARSDTIWNRAKESVIAPAASWTFDILITWLKEEIKQGLPSLRSLAG